MEGTWFATTRATIAFALYRLGLMETVKGTTALQMSTAGLMVTIGGAIALMALAIATTGPLSDALGMLAGAMLALALVSGLRKAFEYPPPVSWGMWAVTAALGMAAGYAIKTYAQGLFPSGSFDTSAAAGVAGGSELPKGRMYDSGGPVLGARMYDTGGPTTEHGMAVLQKGETVIPKTRNMLEGGVTLNIGGDVVTDDAEDFAERIANVLPEALRAQSDIGGI